MDEVYEFFKNFFPAGFLLTFPIVFLIVPIQYSSASNEFSAYRMQQFNFYGVSHGCRSSSFSLEAKSLKTWKTPRHCVITRLKDLTNYKFLDIAQQAGALLVMLPKEMTSLSADEKASVVDLEKAMLSRDVNIPVYFLLWEKELQNIISNVDILTANDDMKSDKKETAVDALFNSVFAMGYQIVVNAPKPSPLPHSHIPVLQGKLSAYGSQSAMSPTIVIVAHYDSQNVVPELSFGADSNGSGVIMLLELARMFSKLYSKTETQPRYNLVFLLPGGGKLSYLGSKKWIEDQSESADQSDESSVLLQNVAFVVCLDSLAASKGIYAHVSKPPKNGTVISKVLQELENVASEESTDFQIVHKKINLGEQMLAWEHERYSMKRIPAFTLSSLTSHKDSRRNTIFDTKDTVNLNNLHHNTKLVAETLARLIYEFSDSNVLPAHKVELDSLKYGLEFISSHPRSMQIIAERDNSLVISLHNIMKRYLRCNVTMMQADKNDPEFVFYDVTKSTVHIYSVKPAIFDLVLTFIIAVYLTLVYYTIQQFPLLYSTISATVAAKKKVY
ncbi:hypothetical protein V9T40_005950 [Parthenolecanium corni]|uniref:Nicalin n=1 Tax=Parthenolecanium corni TaxID=536013 RepID=A0AAN9TT12_9HEMI